MFLCCSLFVSVIQFRDTSGHLITLLLAPSATSTQTLGTLLVLRYFNMQLSKLAKGGRTQPVPASPAHKLFIAANFFMFKEKPSNVDLFLLPVKHYRYNYWDEKHARSCSRHNNDDNDYNYPFAGAFLL